MLQRKSNFLDYKLNLQWIVSGIIKLLKIIIMTIFQKHLLLAFTKIRNPILIEIKTIILNLHNYFKRFKLIEKTEDVYINKPYSLLINF